MRQDSHIAYTGTVPEMGRESCIENSEPLHNKASNDSAAALNSKDEHIRDATAMFQVMHKAQSSA